MLVRLGQRVKGKADRQFSAAEGTEELAEPCMVQPGVS